ncbi:hypothetical protein ERJ75_000438400 [Trypanosoma vivax]|nr:hypothetical protein TRVL_09987 [Trypanosoma vivax]KAH8616844.1 hypothetical protein ERJ75_000438400 [Trypanosoma vivax]
MVEAPRQTVTAKMKQGGVPQFKATKRVAAVRVECTFTTSERRSRTDSAIWTFAPWRVHVRGCHRTEEGIGCYSAGSNERRTAWTGSGRVLPAAMKGGAFDKGDHATRRMIGHSRCACALYCEAVTVGEDDGRALKAQGNAGRVVAHGTLTRRNKAVSAVNANQRAHACNTRGSAHGRSTGKVGLARKGNVDRHCKRRVVTEIFLPSGRRGDVLVRARHLDERHRAATYR